MLLLKIHIAFAEKNNLHVEGLDKTGELNTSTTSRQDNGKGLAGHRSLRFCGGAPLCGRGRLPGPLHDPIPGGSLCETARHHGGAGDCHLENSGN